MKKAYLLPNTDEPIGIVISRGSRAEPIPMFSAYFWGPAPEPVAVTDETSKAA